MKIPNLLFSFLLILLFPATSIAQFDVDPVVQFGHPGYIISSVILSPDGEIMATADGDFLKLWDISSGLELRSFKGETNGLSGGYFSANGDDISYVTGGYFYTRSVLTGDIISRIKLEEYLEEKNINAEDYLTEENYKEYFVTSYSEDRSLKAVIKDDIITITRTETEEVIQELNLSPETDAEEEETSNNNRRAMMPRLPFGGGNRNDSGAEDDAEDFLSFFRRMTFSPDNQALLVDTTLYNITSGAVQFEFSPHKYGIISTNTMFQPNSSDLIFCGRLMIELRLEEEEEEEEKFIDPLAQINAILSRLHEVNSKPGNTVIFANTTTGEVMIDGNTTNVSEAEFTNDQQYLITGHIDKTVNIWNISSGTKQFEIKLRADEDFKAIQSFGVSQIVQTADHKRLIVACSGTIPEDKLTMWDISTGRRITHFGAAIPPVSLDVQQSSKDSIIIQEYKDYLFPFEQMNYRDYGSYRMLSLTNGRAPALFPKFDTITFSPNLDYYLAKPSPFQTIKIYSSEYNEFITELKNSQGEFELLAFSNNGKWVAGYNDQQLYLWDTQTGDLVQQLSQEKLKMIYLVFDPNDEYLICTYDPKRIRFYELNNFGEIFYEKKPGIVTTGVDRLKTWTDSWKTWTTRDDGTKVWAVDNDNSSVSLVQNNKFLMVDRRLNQANTAAKYAKLVLFREYYDIDVSLDGKYAAAWRDDMASVQFIDLENDKELSLIEDKKIMLTSSAASILTASVDDSSKDYIYTFLRNRLAFREFTAISPNWDCIAIATKFFGKEAPEDPQDQRIKVVPIGKKRSGAIRLLSNKEIEGTYRLADSEDYAEGVIFSPDGEMIAASSNSLNSIRIWDAADGSILKTLEGHSGKIAFTPNSKTLISTGWDRQIKVWDLDTEKELYSFIAIKGQNDYITILPNGYYNTSRKNTNAIAFAYGKDAYPFDQFDIQFNRPDLLLRQFEASIATDTNEALIQAYYRSYLRRLDKLNLSEESFRTYMSLPQVEVEEHPFAQSSRTVTIKVNAEDDQSKLNNLFATINGVPVFTGGFRDISARASRTYSGTISFELSEGFNQLQVFVVNEHGAASLKYNATIEYTGAPAKKTLHIVTLGTSEFVDSRFNLDFPIKDMIDFRTLYSTRSGDFDDVVPHRLEGENFTLAKFRQLKATLSKTPPDDEVICFFSTHGLLNEELDYYLATYDVDFESPDERGLSYAEVEAFLMSIGARNKLVFLDACHSGELDKESLEQARQAQEISGTVKFKAVRSSGWEQLPGQQSFDLMKELFIDLRAGTGATVIASASAVEFAYEGGEWNNSAFTYCLIRALKEKVADLNNDGQITVVEIQQYLSYAVSKLTNDVQQPTNRVENIFNNYKIW